MSENKNSDTEKLDNDLPLVEKYRSMAANAYELSEVCELLGQWDDAVYYLQIALSITQRVEDKTTEAKIRVLLGSLLWKRGDFHKAREILQKAKQLAEELSDDKVLGDCFYHLGELYYVEATLMRNRDHTAALDYHEKAFALREKTGDKKGVIQSLSRLGTLYEHMKDQDQALEYHNRAIEMAEKIDYKRGLYRPITHIGAFYREQGDLKTALEYYQRALEICREIGDRQGLVFALGNVGRMLYNLDEKKFEEAVQLCREALTIAESLGFILAIGRTLMITGDLYASHGDHDIAKELFQRARELAVNAGYEAHCQFVERRIAELEKE